MAELKLQVEVGNGGGLLDDPVLDEFEVSVHAPVAAGAAARSYDVDCAQLYTLVERKIAKQAARGRLRTPGPDWRVRLYYKTRVIPLRSTKDKVCIVDSDRLIKARFVQELEPRMRTAMEMLRDAEAQKKQELKAIRAQIAQLQRHSSVISVAAPSAPQHEQVGHGVASSSGSALRPRRGHATTAAAPPASASSSSSGPVTAGPTIASFAPPSTRSTSRS